MYIQVDTTSKVATSRLPSSIIVFNIQFCINFISTLFPFHEEWNVLFGTQPVPCWHLSYSEIFIHFSMLEEMLITFDHHEYFHEHDTYIHTCTKLPTFRKIDDACQTIVISRNQTATNPNSVIIFEFIFILSSL